MAERSEDRKRNRNADDQRAAPASQEQQDHHAGEAGGDQRLAHHALNGGAHEDRLIGQRRDLQLRRQRRQNLRKRALHGVDDVERGGLAGARHGHQNAAASVGADDIGLHRKAVAHLRDVLHIDGRAVHGLDGQVVQFVEHQRAAVDPDLIFGLRQLGGARGQNQVLQVQGIRDVDRRKLFGVELVQIQVHHHRPRLSAKRIRNGRALHGAERRADEVVAQIEDFLLAQSLAGKAQLQDGNARRVVFQNVGRETCPAACCRTALVICAVTCATAMSIWTLGWK